MTSKRSDALFWMLQWLLVTCLSFAGAIDTTSLNHIANVSYAADNIDLSSLASIFSPRMDFDQWKPLTGRGDPLRNDPTYDYEPPVLERVHYWADDTRLEREHYPERKSEVLMLGVSSRKPSVAPRQPPPRRHPRPSLPKYEDFTYKVNEHYPMTILVPPPPPPPGHQQQYVYTENKIKTPSQFKFTETPPYVSSETTPATQQLTSLYALQESNLVFQSSTTTQDWVQDSNVTNPISINIVSSDYAGWGPTTPLNENDLVNDTHNLIPNDHIELSKHPYTFYKPMLSEAPPPPQPTTNSILLPTFLPTPLPATKTSPVPSVTKVTQQDFESTTDLPINVPDYYDETTTPKSIISKFKITASPLSNLKTDQTIFDMLGPMMSMPMVNGPERPEDHLYAHASENLQVFKEHPTEDTKTLETMQTMQPPPPVKNTESATEPQYYPNKQHISNKFIHKKPSKFTLDPYLHMRFTTASPTITTDSGDSFKPTTESAAVPMYLIIQGHSKVKTYSSKPNINDDRDTISNEIPKANETTEVKHLHPIKEKKIEKSNFIRESRSKNLKKLVEDNIGSIKIQEADVGIHYDVSDGSDVPVEIYRRGIVDTDENNYSSKRNANEKRTKRQIELEDLLPFDEDTIEEYIYNFLDGKKNSTGITGIIAQAVTSDAASVVDELEDDDDNDREEEEEEEER